MPARIFIEALGPSPDFNACIHFVLPIAEAGDHGWGGEPGVIV